MPAGERYLIVNADDFGQTAAINRGVIAAHWNGIVTSASLMVRWPNAAEAAALAREHPELSIGLHFDLGEWAYRDGEWVPVYRVLETDDRSAVEAEAQRQLSRFRDLTGSDPTHLDAHQHAHREEPVRSVLRHIADALAIPLRSFHPRVTYRGDFYGQTAKGYPMPEAIGLEALIAFLTSLPAGVTELGCHPGESDEMDCMYVAERPIELATLCDPWVRRAVGSADVTLVSFRDLKKVWGD